MSVKGDCEGCCKKCTSAVTATVGEVGDVVISASVGLGGVNKSIDVKNVQGLLNDVRPERGGPVPPLDVDGISGPLTCSAIRNFQQAMRLPYIDSRVDPAGPTLQALNSERRNKTANPDRQLRESQRIAMAISSLADTKYAVQKALRVVEAAYDYVLCGPGSTQSPEAFDFVSRHFAFTDSQSPQTLRDLGYIKTIYHRMSSVLVARQGSTGTFFFGDTMHAIDPTPGKHPPLWKAFVYGEAKDIYVPSLIYWTDAIDGHPRDRYTYITLHELGHFVDGDDPTLQIVDHGYIALGTVFGLNHYQRMHNAENYAMLAFHRAFGSSRLTAMYPNIANFSWD